MLTSITDGTQLDGFRDLFRFYRERCSSRHDALFVEFLPKGYRATTLSSVSQEYVEQTILAKLHLGMLITLYDDFADNPKLQNARLLDELYKVPYASSAITSNHLSDHDQDILDLGIHLGDQLLTVIRSFPHYALFSNFFQFDLWQFYQCNRFSQLLTSTPSAANHLELSTYGPHNMGMVAAGTIDLMSSPHVQLNELGAIRTALALGQRIGRICNVLTTFDREIAEHDMTNELNVMSLEESRMANSMARRACTREPYAKHRENQIKLEQEREVLFSKIEAMADSITTFDIQRYIEGLRYLQHLHESMTREI